ncbi:MAG: hypothetical protein JNM86_03760 [Phycisphaerae bacterium]|nr:hypothetical protein [Phycisphaerae bacterium]
MDERKKCAGAARATAMVAAAGLSAAVISANAGTYALDDGTGSNNLGPSFACEFMWGNIFEVQPDAGVITTISVSYGTLGTPQERPVRVYLYQMKNADDPTDAELIATATGLSGLQRTNIFLDYPIAPRAVYGSFFVSASMQVFGNATVIPARYDASSAPSADRSWFFGADSYLGMPLSDAPFSGNMANNIIKGVFMVRATGVPNTCPADLNWDGVVDDSDFVAFAGSYTVFDCAGTEMPFGCPSDFNADGFVDDGDFVVLASAYDALACP